MAVLDDLLNLTLQNYKADLVDNVFNASVYCSIMKDKRRLSARPVAGKQLQENIIASKNTTFDFKGPYQTVTAAPQEHTVVALFDWVIYSGSVTVSDYEIAQNQNSKFQIANLLQSKTRVAEASMADKLNEVLHGANSGTPSKPLGLQDIVSDSVTIGGLNPSTHTWWKAYIESTTESLSLTRLNEAYLKVSQPSGHNAPEAGDMGAASTGLAVEPDLELTTPELWLHYHATLTPQLRIDFASKVGKQGFSALQHMGAKVLWEKMVPAGTWYLLNTRYLYLVFGMNAEGGTFSIRKFEKIPLQPVRVAEFYMIICHVTNNRRYQGKLTNKS